MTHEIAAIRFCDGAAVPLDQAFAYADAYQGPRGYVSPREVIWVDGSWSFAKGWWKAATSPMRLVEIGAGAYGSMRVATREA